MRSAAASRLRITPRGGFRACMFCPVLPSAARACLVLDGVYRCGADDAPAFVEADAPTDGELHALLQTIVARLMKMLTRRGVLVEDMGQTCLAEPDADGEEAEHAAGAAGRGCDVSHRFRASHRAEGADLAWRDATR